MEQEKKPSSVGYAKLVAVFQSVVWRNIIIGVALILSLFAMFTFDKGNVVRQQYMPFLEGQWLKDFLGFLNIEQMELPLCAWFVFLALFGTVCIYLVAGMFQRLFVEPQVRKNKDAFRNEAHARRHYAIWYNIFVFIICCALAFVAYMWIGRTLEKQFEWTFAQSAEEFNVWLNLLYAILLCILFALLIPLTLMIVYGLFRFVMWIASYFVYLLTNFKKDVRISNELAVRNLDAVRSYGAKGSGGGGDGDGEEDSSRPKPADKKGLFPSLVRMDDKYTERETVENVEQISLSDFTLRFQSYAISRKIYYGLPLIRSFIAGLASTRLIVLEGLSGTGKSMLPRMFSEFTGTKTFFAPVQATWRDKTDLLGYYSEFTKTFKSTDFLQNLYEASYLDRMNIMVLDEMNISRIEYYFADFLSILEYPPEDWNIRVFEPEFGQEMPAKLPNGYIKIPENTWFIGTANTDDSTFTITDKVYDRAIVLDFSEKFSPITSEYPSAPIKMDYQTMKAMFKEAQENPELCLNDEDLEKFTQICDFTRRAFDIRFGNRIMVQIENFVPVYVALGGTKEAALDFMFARKILRKLNGMFEDYVKEELIALTKLINNVYGKGTFRETEKTIAKIMKKLV